MGKMHFSNYTFYILYERFYKNMMLIFAQNWRTN